MTNQDIDRRLALAIGYTADRVRIDLGGWIQVLNDDSRMDGPTQYSGGQRFDHTDPAVIWPIAERFKAFPMDRLEADTYFATVGYRSDATGEHENPATASALAIIKYVEGKA